jgi:multidrug resistance efflux pump
MLLSGIAGIAVAIASYGLFSGKQSEAEMITSTNASSVAVPQQLVEGTIPLQVSGVVRAADQTTIYAQTAGTVVGMPAREGASVSAGQVLVEQSTPIADAQSALAAAERSLSNVQQSQAVAVSQQTALQTGLRAYSAREVATLRSVAGDSRIEAGTEGLVTVLESGVLTLIESINYVQRNRPLFSAEGMRLYDQVTTELYGQVPNHFRGGVLRPQAPSEEIIALVEEVKNNPDVTVSELQILTTVIEKQLEALANIFATGEDEVFDRRSVYGTDEVQGEYLARRSALLGAQQTLQSTTARLTAIVDGVLEDAAIQDVNTQVTAFDREIAELQASFTAAIEAQADAVAAAAQGVVFAQRSLGRPTAPFAGVVSRVHVDVGEYVMPGTPLLTLVGLGARELVVTVPAYLLTDVEVGQEFVVGEKTVGYVSRFSTVAEGGSGEVVITLTTTEPIMAGSSLTGQLRVSAKAGIYQVPRTYVHFDADGPYIRYENGNRSAVVVTYDSGRDLFIQVAEVEDSPLQPALSIKL